jgi:uncharacterized membrane protein HdeD (DUF308 family)
VLILLFPTSSGLAICYAVGAILCVWGVVRVVTYFAADRLMMIGSFGLVQGAALLLAGAFILARPELLAGVLTTVFGILLIIDGVLKLQHAISLLRIRAPRWWVILLGAAVTAALGIVVVCEPFATARTLMQFVGAALVVGGALDLLTLVYVSHSVKTVQRRTAEADAARERMRNAVDVDFKEEN